MNSKHFYTINENEDGSYTCSHVNKCEKEENAYSVNMNNDLFEVKRCFIFEFLPEDIREYLTHLNNFIMNNKNKGEAIYDLRNKHIIRNFFEIQLGIRTIPSQYDRIASSRDKELKQTILHNIGVYDISKDATKLQEKIESINKELKEKKPGSNTKNTEIDNKIRNIKTEIINDYNKFIESIDSLYKKIKKEKLAKRRYESMEDLLNRIPEQKPNEIPNGILRSNSESKIPTFTKKYTLLRPQSALSTLSNTSIPVSQIQTSSEQRRSSKPTSNVTPDALNPTQMKVQGKPTTQSETEKHIQITKAEPFYTPNKTQNNSRKQKRKNGSRNNPI
jgi:hypothetical protein